MNLDTPIFIIGNPRSGTTLLRLMLTSHSKICIPPEAGFMIWFYNKYKDFDFNSTINIEHALRLIFNSRKFETWNLDYSECLKYIIKHRISNYTELCEIIYKFYCSKNCSGAIYWGDKNNFYLNHIDDLQEMFPKAYFIHIIRDGRDVASSYISLKNIDSDSKYAPKLPFVIEEIAKEWSNNVALIANNFQNISEDHNITIKYEEIVLHPEALLSRICTLMGLEFEKQMLEYYNINRNKQLEPYDYHKWKEKTLHPLDSSAIGKYKQILSTREIKAFTNIALKELNRFNYID